MTSADIPYLISCLSIEEKVSLLSGVDTWQTRDIPRLGIRSLKTTDGPSGARGKLLVDGCTAAFVPAPICQAATWSKDLCQRLGAVLRREVKSKAASVLLAPTICCARNPLGGRNFECYGEDPFISGTLAVQYIKGVQEMGDVVATVKHFVANEQEYARYSIDAVISEKVLREIYLRPFEMAVRSESPPGCIMTSYNCVNGLHADMHPRLLRDIIRDEWKFEGLVMSDWGGTNSTWESFMAGLDLEMPGPPDLRGGKLLKLIKESNDPAVTARLDESVFRMLSLLEKLNLLGMTEEAARQSRQQPETSATTVENIKLIREVAACGIVLLKNSAKMLPLVPKRLHGKRVAFIGPNAKKGTPGGGGSASMNPQYLSHPMDAFKSLCESRGINVTVSHAPGAYTFKWLPALSASQWSVEGGGKVMRIDYFKSIDLSGPVVSTQFRENSNIELTDSAPLPMQTDPVHPYSFRVQSTLIPLTTGVHRFSLTSVGRARLYVEGELVVDNSDWTKIGESFWGFGSVELIGEANLTAGQGYAVVVECWSDPKSPAALIEDVNPVFTAHPSVRIGYQEQLSETTISDAVSLANQSDVTVAVFGLNDEWESEGYDRSSMALPGNQNELILALIENFKDPESLIFVNKSGSPVEIPWIDRIHTFVQSWYGGQEAGNALADVLLGMVNPCGRLPLTWPKQYSDLSFSSDLQTWPGSDGKVIYKEQSQIGYRWFMHSKVRPQWWSGFGLSYTQFFFSLAEPIEHQDYWQVLVCVKNVGSMQGTSEPEDIILVSFESTPLIDGRKEGYGSLG
ncbi:glycoside hydrolase superfamily [Ilyonectria robusta]|uniref:glycoside hydrolase superfamily n=1 Tax=Ilyonectria robusta TaxID=1079257 RepID=UPI001E8CCDAE|nr:glycoside hydrolase superfamily [Ilyonectria robusta]KAH8699705.1 glycoside hydrolase superfamily [Ilyonectria robusta]